MKTISFTRIEKIKITWMIITAVYAFLWFITLWGFVVKVFYDKNPGDIAKFWIKLNSINPIVSIIVFAIVLIVSIVIIMSEEKDLYHYKQFPLKKQNLSRISD
jgi:cell division protein FtsL